MKETTGWIKNLGRGDDAAYTWFGVSKTIFLRLLFSAALLCAGLFLPENSLTVFLMLFSFLISGYDVIARAAVRLVKEKVLGEELLITLVGVLAFTINESYEAAAVMLIYQIGYVLRAYAVELTRGSLRDRIDPYPSEVTLQQGESTVSVAPEQIQPGDVLLLQAGERVPVDCTVLGGSSEVEMAGLLGHSQRRTVEAGAAVPAGAVNITSSLRVLAEKSADRSILSQILDIASDEELCHGSTEEDVERYASVYAPFALGLSILMALLLLIFTRSSTEAAIHRALVLLIASCPTAFLVPIPLIYLAGLYRSVQKGVLIKGSTVLDAVAGAGAVILDKDDMLTTGLYRVMSVKSDKMDPNVLLSVAAHAQSRSDSPIAATILNAYEGIIDPSLIAAFQEEDGGVSAIINDVIITMGSREFLQGKGIETEDLSEGNLAVYMALNGQYAGCILLSDLIREDAPAAVMSIESTGADCILLSEDSEERTQATATAAGIREYYAQCMPLDRLEKIQEIKERFPSNSVLYLGTGVNDSASLSASDVGVCVDGLSLSAARETGSVVVMDKSGAPLADAIDTARSTRKVIRETLTVILLMKVAVFALSLFGIAYQLWFAMLVDVVASITGVLLSTKIFDNR